MQRERDNENSKFSLNNYNRIIISSIALGVLLKLPNIDIPRDGSRNSINVELVGAQADT